MKDYKFYICILIYKLCIYIYVDIVMDILIIFSSILFTQASPSTEYHGEIGFLRYGKRGGGVLGDDTYISIINLQ